MSDDAELNIDRDIRVFETALSSALFGRIVSAVRDIGDENLKDGYSTSFWFPKDAKPANIVEETITALIKLAVPPAAHTGTEWWLGRLRYGKPLNFHFDQDLTRSRKFGKHEYPLYGSILYLNSFPSSPTVILGHIPGSNPDLVVPEKSAYRVSVAPVANRYAVFRGNLSHGVVPNADSVDGGGGGGKEHQPEEFRLTLLVNYWHVRPLLPICTDFDGSIYGRLLQDKLEVRFGHSPVAALVPWRLNGMLPTSTRS